MFGAILALQHFQQQAKFSVAASYPMALDISDRMDRDQVRQFGQRRTRPPRVNVLSDVACANALAAKAVQCERNLSSGSSNWLGSVGAARMLVYIESVDFHA